MGIRVDEKALKEQLDKAGCPERAKPVSYTHLTGSSRIYSNAKPGIIMEAFSQAGESNLVFIINELDKALSKNGNGNPADVLLPLLDNLGFTDNYMECIDVYKRQL